MNFIIYDIALLVAFVIFIGLFLFFNRKNLKREGLLFLYKTSWGIKLINYVGSKYKKTLNVLSYISVTLGYILMVLAIYTIGKIVWIYAFFPNIVKAIKVPPIMPLLPYVTDMVKIPGLPSFYFIYWIIILAIVAILHEFSHGIFAIYNKVKIKSTGFGFFPFFFPVFLAAFVEQDEKDMNKGSNFGQRAILSAGTFANVLTAIFFFIVMAIFFLLTFSPSGIVFDNYAYTLIPTPAIISINGLPSTNLSYLGIMDSLDDGINTIETTNGTYVLNKKFLGLQGGVKDYLYVYYDSPAVRNGINGTITQLNGYATNTVEDFVYEFSKYKTGDEITITTKVDSEFYNYKIILENNPEKENTPWLGVGFSIKEDSFKNRVVRFISFKESHIDYESNLGEAGIFIYNLLWWLVLISISVAIINMLPVGIFDGGRFFYLTILAITKSEKKAKRTFQFLTYFFLFLLFLVMFFWGMSFFK